MKDAKLAVLEKEALEMGIDPDLLYLNLERSVQERMDHHRRALVLIQKLQDAYFVVLGQTRK